MCTFLSTLCIKTALYSKYNCVSDSIEEVANYLTRAEQTDREIGYHIVGLEED